ncbi:MAG: hypothetical protein K6C94_00495 [Candidatus Gastranaerophilales bacterium]|nr:hypothetical protein [Candidatus Gastranaerophilales bacterium]
MNIPDGLLCAKTHEFVIDYGDYAVVGLTDILLQKLGDIIFVEFPDTNSVYAKKEVFATVEADGAATELYMPVAGKIIEINPLLNDSLDALNNEPLSDGWLVKIEPLDFQADIYDLSDYNDYVQENNQ